MNPVEKIKQLGESLYRHLRPGEGVSGRAWHTAQGPLVIITHVAEGGVSAYFFLNGRPIEGLLAAGVLGTHLLWRARRRSQG